MPNLLIQVASAGLLISGANNSYMVTHGQWSAPGEVLCPITHTGPSSCAATELVQYVGESTYCRWQLQIVSSSTADTDRFAMSAGLVLDEVLAGQLGDPNWITGHWNWTFDPCDLDFDGAVATDADRSLFKTTPYDYDGSGYVNIWDWYWVTNSCGGG